MLPWIDCGIVYLGSHSSSLYWIGCEFVYLCSHGSSSGCIGLIVTLFICVLMDLSHVALD